MQSIMGHVLDNRGRPVGRAKISLDGKAVGESEYNGFFSVALPRPASRVALTFAAEGHVSNTRVYDSRATGINTVVIWPVAFQVKFDPSHELDLELGSSRIQVPSGALARQDGEKLKGPATLRFTLFDVTSRFQRAAAPGDFSGRLLDRQVRRLSSYGIFDFDLQDAQGGRPGLRRGASVRLAIAIPPSLAGRAPRKVGYFDFDAPQGLWNQVGTFDLAPDGLTYNGSVTSFGGAHNLDDPQDTVCVTLKVESFQGYAMPNANVTAHGAQYDSGGISDANGFVCLLVQRNASFTVTAFGTSGSSSFSTLPWVTQAFTSPNFSSTSADCGDPTLCPLVGTVWVDYIVGTGAHFSTVGQVREVG
jgi:hypothetical protein